MTEWKEYKLGEIVHIIGGGTPKTSEPKYWNGSIPWLSVVDFNNGNKYVYDAEKYITQEGLENSSTRLLKKGDIIISARGTVGAMAMIGREMAFNQSCYGIRNSELVDNHYLFYLLKNSINELKQNSHGGVFDTITRETFNMIDISLPPLPEQIRIASILSSLDDKIDLLHRENKTLEAMAETLFRQLFIEEAKEDWEEGKLREIVDISIGRTPPRKETKWFSTNPSDVKWLSIKDMGAGDVFLFNTSEYLTKEAVETFSIPIIPKDTVVLSFKMTVGRVGITTEDMLSNEAIAHFKFTNKTPITKEYLYLFLKTYKYETLGSTSSIVTAINSAMIKNIEVTIPDADTMKRYKNQTQPMFDKIYNNQEQINTLIQIRDRLLPRLMNNEINL